MLIRAIVPAIAAVVLFLPFAPTAKAQPPAIGTLATRSELSSQDRDRLAEYVTYWVDELTAAAGDKDAGDVERSRERLVSPLQTPGATAVFLDAYSRTALPKLQTALEADSAYLATNTLIVVSQLGTARALDLLQDHISVTMESRWEARLHAALGCRAMLSSDRLVLGNPRDVSAAARALRNAAEEETNGLVLRRQLEAILAAGRNPIAETARGQIRELLVEALDNVAERAASARAGNDNPGTAELLNATTTVLTDLRNGLFELDFDAQQSFARTAGPVLGKMLAAPEGAWEQLNGDEAMDRQRIGDAISVIEQFLITLDTIMRRGEQRPRNVLHEAWNERDRERYREILGQWRQVLQSRVYS